jgi:hypothetical protein
MKPARRSQIPKPTPTSAIVIKAKICHRRLPTMYPLMMRRINVQHKLRLFSRRLPKSAAFRYEQGYGRASSAI